jgi:hypothetical protein
MGAQALAVLAAEEVVGIGDEPVERDGHVEDGCGHLRPPWVDRLAQPCRAILPDAV